MIRAVRTSALASGDAAVLLGVHPRWQFVATGVTRPSTWLDTAGSDVALAALCGVLLWLAAAWVAVGLAAGLGTRLPGVTGRACASLARVVVPRVLLRVVLGSTGLGLLAAPAAQAVSPPHTPTANVRTWTDAGSVHLLAAVSPWAGTADVPSPTWPVTPAPSSTPTRLPAPTPPTSATPVSPHSHPSTPPTPRTDARVHRGDSLWLLAAHRLGAHAVADDVAHYWPQIYAANRSVIGDDPSVIHPGQVLDLPTPIQESS